ncbi:xanthine dehydrogenase accessory factor [Anaerosolibacter carboniphilus]|uniref:Xanthine dehydrogenase accessory factor n=1 Tax=Anaerosolibacter carboniphilus TaxID=1417629 RepID=A0A841KU64_9FIRM|nr:selenium-dependent molybdenum cofactor biosynthesis protein YqeB [Anaerosolibacter carboniphilus]MBB6216913.1 xanthine dehydrogenase accessory factor [Anaerosolibacter carboniphilus]
MMDEEDFIIIKGAGDIASGVAHKLFRSGFPVVMTDIERPTCVRRNVSFANCIYEGEWEIEGVRAKKAQTRDEVLQIAKGNRIPVLVDPFCRIKEDIPCSVLVDAVLAKKNIGTNKEDAPFVIGLGPGFYAGKDVDVVIETNRGHNLGKIIFDGEAEPNTGVPGNIAGYGMERVLRAPVRGIIRNNKGIGDQVNKADLIAWIGLTEVRATIDGVIRGLIYDGLEVHQGWKIGDIDPRPEALRWTHTISDKARCIGGGVLEAILMKSWKK